MTNPRGARFEKELLVGLRNHGLDVEKVPNTGRLDEGDLVVKGLLPGTHILIEAKDEARINLPAYIREANIEAEHYAAARSLDPAFVPGVAVVKRRGAGYLGAYVVSDVASYLAMLGV